MAAVTLIVSDIPVSVVEWSQAFARGIFQIIDEWLHREMTRGAEFDALRPLKYQNSAHAGDQKRKRHRTRYKHAPRCWPDCRASVPNQTISHNQDSDNSQCHKHAYRNLLDRVSLESRPFLLRARHSWKE